jgi:transcriptional regulator with XRE-family HTH domain
MSDLVQFAAEIRAGRAVLGWSRTELARRTAVTQRAITALSKILCDRGSKPESASSRLSPTPGFGSSRYRNRAEQSDS